MNNLRNTVAATGNKFIHGDNNRLEHPTEPKGVKLAKEILDKHDNKLKVAIIKATDAKTTIVPHVPRLDDKVPDDLYDDDNDNDEEPDDCVIPPEKDIEFCDTNWLGQYKTKEKCDEKKEKLTNICQYKLMKQQNIRREIDTERLNRKLRGAGKRKKKTKSKRRRTKRRRTKKHRS